MIELDRLHSADIEWFNEERKHEYIRYVAEIEEENDAVVRTIATFFNRVSGREEDAQRDISAFHSKELADVFMQNGWVNAATFIAYRTLLRKYTNWCIKNGYADKNPAMELRLSAFNNYEKPVGERSKYFYSYEEFINAIDNLYGKLDRYVLPECLWYLAFLGFTKDEASKILRDQIGETSIQTDTWCANDIPPEMMQVFHVAKNLDEYDIDTCVNDVKQHRTQKLVDNPYLLRPTEKTDAKGYANPCSVAILDNWGQGVRRLQKQMIKDGKNLSIANKSINFHRIHTFGRFIALEKWEAVHGEANSENAMEWCRLVRRFDERANQPKKAFYAFLLSYNVWKSTKPLVTIE